jgi:two-component system, CAI-1 autoinducer sensor kinase/phosphatase CqsS
VHLDRLRFNSAKARFGRWLMDEVVHAPLEPILHPSRTRLWWAGVCTILGHLGFYWIWHTGWPQPFESATLRTLAASAGLVFFAPSITRDVHSRTTSLAFLVVCWLTLPAFFFWMYSMNDGNAVWLASVAAMLLIYYHLTDWRIATVGSMGGSLVGWVTVHLGGKNNPHALDGENLIVILFAWGVGLLLGASSANLRRVRLLNTLSTMGVMAHELRTPLATVHLMADVLRNLAQSDMPASKRDRLMDLASRLQHLVRNMNRQVDTQISNAQLMRLPREQVRIDAAALVRDVVADYPYRSSRERDCVRVQIHKDFPFIGSPALFAQVLTNLLKNALHALASARSAPEPGALRVEVGVHRGLGRIAVSDDGIGIAHDQLQRIFEPFYSTQAGVGSGLGLSFCKSVVEAAHGTLSVHAEPHVGAVFMIDLPLAPTSS